MVSTEPNRKNRLRIAFIGRLTGPKGEIAKKLIATVFPHFPDIRFTIVGGPIADGLQTLAGVNVEFTGWITDLTPLFTQFDLVIASGRTAIEALYAGVPILAVGEARCIGFIVRENLSAVQRTNFGDCERGSRIDPMEIIDHLERFRTGYRPDTDCYPELLVNYSGKRVAAAIEQTYLDARLEYRLGHRSLPILCYHRVVPEALPDSRINIHVTRNVLDRHLAQLRRRGMTPITFTDLLGNTPLPRRPIMLTFDDGYRDNHEHLLPLLEKHDARAVIFVLGDRSLRANVWDSAHGEPAAPLMSDTELRACHATGRVEIGSHGLSHHRLSELSANALEHELITSKSALETLIDAPVHAFAYPYGEWGSRERDAVERAGYAFGIATDQGAPLTHDRYAVTRRIIFPGTGSFGFYKKTSRWYPRYRRLLGRT